MDVQFTDEVSTELWKYDLNPERLVVEAARTSTGSKGKSADEGLIRALVRDRHGVPFEHVGFTWRIRVPLFVQQQVLKHRAGVSISQESGRYTEHAPEFYVPSYNRPLGQTGRAMDYNLVHVPDRVHGNARDAMMNVAEKAFYEYTFMIESGVAKEIARSVLPANLMTTAVITMNSRALMHFLSLRRNLEGQAYVSHPQYEIEQLAVQLEATMFDHMPVTLRAFNEFGRVAP